MTLLPNVSNVTIFYENVKLSHSNISIGIHRMILIIDFVIGNYFLHPAKSREGRKPQVSISNQSTVTEGKKVSKCEFLTVFARRADCKNIVF